MEQRLIRLPRVIDKVALQKSQIWRMAKEGTFPQPIKISHKVTAWIESEVDQWVADRIAEARGES
ncbi:helix-turn-helix transcriptional regulator [Sulfurovum sp. CS9]|uniref:helix-turn-helix transcriptional regulator n=1 Tax=Sulfurovum sp. CS9 TaxID=3391146 RepID=UPI0039EBF80D